MPVAKPPVARLLLLLTAALLSSPATPRDWLGLAGAEFSAGNGYLYAGALAPLADGAFGEGWVQRYWLDRVSYEYELGGQTIEARAPGLSAALGYTRSGSGWRYTGYLGLGYRDTDLSPDDRGNDARGGQAGALVQLDAETSLPRHWRAAAIASFSTADSGYWARLRLVRHAGWRLHPGVEAVVLGNDAYDAWQLGVVGTGLKLGAGASLGLKAGLRHDSDRDAAAYFGLELVRVWR